MDNPCRRFRSGRGLGHGLTTNLTTLSACRPALRRCNKQGFRCVGPARPRRSCSERTSFGLRRPGGWRDLHKALATATSLLEDVVKPQVVVAMHRPVVGLRQDRRRKRSIMVEIQKLWNLYWKQLEGSAAQPSRRSCKNG